MDKSICLFLLLTCLFCIDSQAQNANISGKVTGAGAALPAATVSLLKGSDSSWIKSVLTDDNGVFLLKDVAAGSYLVTATSIGYETGYQPLTVNDSNTQTYNLELKKQSASLADVTITGKKPFMEMSLGKIVLNVDGSPAATGSNVLELLRRSPGVAVDMNGTISMAGKDNVLVLIDDRPTYLSADQLADYLKTMAADEVSQLELITQPSAKYDAAGNAGIINIKTKRNGNRGFNGSLSYTYGQGVYPFGEGNLSVNYKKNKLNLFLNSSKMDGVGFANWNQDQYFVNPKTDSVTAHTHIHSYPVEHFGIASVRVGADYEANENTKIGTSVRGSYHPNYNHYIISTNSTDFTTADTTTNKILSRDGFIRKDIIANAYLDRKFSKESNLTVNLDYLNYDEHARQDVNNTTYDNQMQALPDPFIWRSQQPARIDVYSVKADYTNTFKGGLKIDAGLKSSLVRTDNDAQFEVYNNNAWMKDTTRSNRFIYNENINALYLSADKSLGDHWQVRGGLRAENTNAHGLQTVHSKDFERSYISLFPTLYVTYKKDKNNQFEINYGRRIDRPDYRSLNPFQYYSFENTYWTGNPDLKPEYTDNIELKHSYKNAVITTLSFSNTNNIIEDMLHVDNATKALYTTPENFKWTRYIYLSVLFNKELYKWWTLNISGHLRYGYYNGFDGANYLTATGQGYAVNMNSQFDLGRGWKAEATANYHSKWKGSVVETVDPAIFMTFGISKKIGERFTIKAATNDPFGIYRMKMHDVLYNFRSDGSYSYASMQYNIGFTWNFGKSKFKGHEADAPEETRRMKID